jgi:hypothetical protein
VPEVSNLSCSGVLCGGYAGYAAVGDWGRGRCEIRGKIMKSAESDVILNDLTPGACRIFTGGGW